MADAAAMAWETADKQIGNDRAGRVLGSGRLWFLSLPQVPGPAYTAYLRPKGEETSCLRTVSVWLTRPPSRAALRLHDLSGFHGHIDPIHFPAR